MNFRNKKIRELFDAETDAVKAEVEEFKAKRDNMTEGDNGDDSASDTGDHGHDGQTNKDNVDTEEEKKREMLENYQQ